MTRFIFFGRLTQEKGIDLILETFLLLVNQNNKQSSGSKKNTQKTDHLTAGPNAKNTISTGQPRTLDIYGSWPYFDACKKASELFPTHIHFHGRAPQSVIREQLSSFDFCLMPSRVIETFGKSALESLSAGVQVIGYRHGGLEQFIDTSLAIWPNPADFPVLINNILNKTIPTPAIPDLSPYTTDTRLAQFQTLASPSRSSSHETSLLLQNTHSEASNFFTSDIPDTVNDQDILDQKILLTAGTSSQTAHRILLVSDFITQTGGGIETFLQETIQLLRANDYEVELCGSSRPVWFWWLFATAANVRERRRVRTAIQTFKPHIVRYHSTLRRMWRLPMTCSPRTPCAPHAQKRRTMHDMGYIYPHPAQLISLSMVPAHWSLREWLETVKHASIMTKILTIAKRFLHKTIALALKKFRHILVPSSFMVPAAQQLVPWKSIDILPHFVS
jgi:Glycosyl transferases group 1